MTLPRALKLANPKYQCAQFGKWGEKMISSPEECGYDISDGHTGNVTGGMADKMQPAHIVADPKRTGSVTDRSIRIHPKQTKAGKPFMRRSATMPCTCARNYGKPHWKSIKKRALLIGLIHKVGPACLRSWTGASAGSSTN